MSYTLAFWAGGDGHDPKTVYLRLNSGETVAEVTKVDASAVEDAIRRRLTGWSRSANLLFPPESTPDEGPAFDVFVGEQVVVFTGHGVDGDAMNEIIDVMRSLGHRLYDPQTDQRFE